MKRSPSAPNPGGVPAAPGPPTLAADARIGLALISAQASGTERRMGFVYRHLVGRFPGRYRLAVAPGIYRVLNEGGFGLDALEGVHVLGPRSRLDRKAGADASLLVNLGRLATLFRYRRELQRWARSQDIEVLQVYLEMVPFLAILPFPEIPTIVSLVSHLPKYFRSMNLSSRLLRRAVRLSLKADCVYRPIADGLIRLGIDPHKLNWPHRNTTDHERFHPEPKEALVSFTARAFEWKNPQLMLSVIEQVLRRDPTAKFALLGEGPLQKSLWRRVGAVGWQDRVLVGFRSDPSGVVNRSLIHVSVEAFDNAPNQSLLEGMAAGCAVIASDVGSTREVVSPDVGILVDLDPEVIATQIADLLARPKHAEALGRAARQRILRDHHIDRYLDYLALLHDFSHQEPVQDGRRIYEPGRASS